MAGKTGILLLSLIAWSCSAERSQSSEAGPTGTPVPAAAAATAKAPSRLCSLYTSAEIQAVLHAPVGEGKVAGPMDSACQWDGDNSIDPPVYAQVQLIDGTEYWEKHSGAKGYELLPGIGREAFVASSLGGWEAGTVTDKAVVFVTLSGGSASRDSAVTFLRSSLDRLGMNK